MLRGDGRRSSGGVRNEQSKVWIKRPRCFVHLVSKSKVRCLFARQLVVGDLEGQKIVDTAQRVEVTVEWYETGSRDASFRSRPRSREVRHLLEQAGLTYVRHVREFFELWPRHDVYKERELNEGASSRLPHRLARPSLTTMLGICRTRSHPRPARNDMREF